MVAVPHLWRGEWMPLFMIERRYADERSDRIADTYRTNLDRLARIKALYDPDNLFRVNRNISPTR